ncbi:uncharacterized protein BDV17DRAFT_275326, partial [Aspergillus undulatus]|uniref:uncharacterized protein n=1 Tax=Aspergillus undulatus TaxID=1810928 RepID=UPI003CCD785E
MAQVNGPLLEFLRAASTGFLAIAAYNTLELIFWIFDFFQQRQGLYFWSILTAAVCLAPFMALVTVATFRITSPLAISVGVAILYPCILAAQVLILYSRLYLLTTGRSLAFVFWLIIISSVILYVPFIIIFIGSSTGDRNFTGFPVLQRINERTTIVGSVAPELIICIIYIYKSTGQLEPIMVMKGRAGRKVMLHLILVNATVIILDSLQVISLWPNTYPI